MQGLIGRKLGMTQVFDGDGKYVAVTVIEAGPCSVVQRKTAEKDGYDAVQLGFADQKAHRVNKAAMGRFNKAKCEPKRVLKEFRLEGSDDMSDGDTVTTSIFNEVSHVDIVGITKGKGFQGVVKRHRMRGGRMTHGGHSKRRVGAIGQCSYPARVAKGQRMPGHMGNKRITVQNLRVIQVREDEGLLLVEGAVPGPTGTVVFVTKALKR